MQIYTVIQCQTFSEQICLPTANNNPVNQIDPEGTDAIWLQFTNALEIVKGTDISISLGFFDINIHTKPIQLGHTSLLVQDSINQWWYFYWGDKHMYLRPCGSSDFNNLSEINSYLSGFDPRPYHNYYVYAINVFGDNEDTGYYYNDTSKYHKIHDGLITGGLYFTGNYVDSYKYCYDEINDAIKKEGKNLNDCTFSYSEGDKTIEIIHLFNRNTNGEYLKLKHYNIAYRNCVQQTLSALKQAKSVKSNPVLYSLLTYEYTQLIPNQIYAELLSYAVFGKAGEYTLNQIRNITKEIWEVIA